MDLFDILTFVEILGRTTFLGTLSLIVLLWYSSNFLSKVSGIRQCEMGFNIGKGGK